MIILVRNFTLLWWSHQLAPNLNLNVRIISNYNIGRFHIDKNAEFRSLFRIGLGTLLTYPMHQPCQRSPQPYKKQKNLRITAELSVTYSEIHTRQHLHRTEATPHSFTNKTQVRMSSDTKKLTEQRIEC